MKEMWTFWLNSLLSLELFCLACSVEMSSLIGSSEPVVGLLGCDVVLPCQVDPPQEIWPADGPVEWIRVDQGPDEFVYALHDGKNNVNDPDLKRRFSLFWGQLKNGNVSLKMYDLKLSDNGTYEIHLPKVKSLKKQSGCKVNLKLGAVSKPKIHIVGQAKDGGLDLQCEAEGWHPQPKMEWRVGKAEYGRLAPQEVKQNQDGLYTVTRNITITHPGVIICQVQLDALNLTRQDNFNVQSFLFNKYTEWELRLYIVVTATLTAIVGVIFCFFRKIRRMCAKRRPINSSCTSSELSLKEAQEDLKKEGKTDSLLDVKVV